MKLQNKAIEIIEGAIDPKTKRADLMVVGKALFQAGLWPQPKLVDLHLASACKILGFTVRNRHVYKN